MKKVKISVSRKPGKITIDNLDEVKGYINEAVKPYSETQYTGNSRARYDKKMLLKLRAEIENGMKEAIAVYSAPLESIKFSQMQLTSVIDRQIAAIDKLCAKNEEKNRSKNKAALSAFYKTNSTILGTHAASIWESPAFIEDKWLDSDSLSMGTKNAVIEKIEKAAKDISTIETTCQSMTPVMLARYFETMSIGDVISFKEKILKAANGRMPGTVRTHDADFHENELVLNCSEETLMRTLDQLKLMNVDYRVKCSDFPSVLHEIKEPSFDSFVAIDIETTGSFGASSGDLPSEIMEIGAVRVENGVITDRFSMLANPGRLITPHVIKLTHITNEMVRNKPSVEEVMREFSRFAGDSILVGHGIKSSDLPFLCRAAKKAGVELNNDYFDTCEYAAELKDKYGWQKIRLEYLSSLFGISQNDAHRANCDAEANVGVYFALKSLNK